MAFINGMVWDGMTFVMGWFLGYGLGLGWLLINGMAFC